MKKKLIIFGLMLISIISCENQEFTVTDFDTKSVFFPYQRPARTLVLGNYDLGFNDNDNNNKFEIGVLMSGVFRNTEDRRVFFEVDPDLVDASLLGLDTVNVQVLPSSYYNIEQQSPVTIPAGSIDGRIPIQLTDDFFNDPLSISPEGTTNYVIPLRITSFENLDTLLVGEKIENVANPIRIRDEDWRITPKDYTLFGIKFINKYDGIYLRRGADVMTNSAGEVTTSEYRAEFIVQDELVTLTTSTRSNVTLFNRVRRGETLISPGNVNLELSFDENDNCTVESSDDVYNVTGTGRFVQDGDEWGGKKQDVIYLDYSYTDVANNENHSVKDTLVIRNRDIKFEEFILNFEKSGN